MENFYCTSMVCNGDHYPIKIAVNYAYKYSTFNFQKLIFCYLKERLFICKYCKKCQDCKALEKAFLFAEEIQKRNVTKDNVRQFFIAGLDMSSSSEKKFLKNLCSFFIIKSPYDIFSFSTSKVVGLM